MKRIYSLLGIGWFFVFSILLGLFTGKFIDEKLGSEPFFMLAGIIFGIIAGMYEVIKKIK